MRVLLLGSGARENALAQKIAESSKLQKLYAAPGNPGIEKFAELVPIQVDELDQLVVFAKENEIDLVVVGPEAPLVLGIVDRFKEVGIFCFGPNRQAAQLEGSKEFSKHFMVKHQIPTARYAAFSTLSEAEMYVNALPEGPVVVKADGLAQGKGVVVAANKEEALEALKTMMSDHSFGSAGDIVVIEEFLEGEEVSLLTFVDGKRLVPMLPVQDHKRIGEGDTGLNTGGMGTYAPTSLYTDLLKMQVEREVLIPLEKALQEEFDYRGCLYVGLMITAEGPKVIEFNARFGDPETEVLLPLLDSDLLDIMQKCAQGGLENQDVVWKDESAVCVILSSQGYPEHYETGFPISGLNEVSEDVYVFHAGTKKSPTSDEIVTSGGRVLALVGVGKDFLKAKEAVYREVNKIYFSGVYYRTDIGYKEEKRILNR